MAIQMNVPLAIIKCWCVSVCGWGGQSEIRNQFIATDGTLGAVDCKDGDMFPNHSVTLKYLYQLSITM